MKWLWVFFLVSSVQAATLAQYYSSPDGSSVQSFTVERGKASYEKRSNFFDKEKSYTLGNFYLSKEAISAEDLKKLEGALAKIKKVDAFLKQKNSSFNDLSNKTPHKSFLLLDDYRISQDSDIYPDLKMLFDKFQSMNWIHKSGIKLSDDFKTVTTIADGKEVKSEKFKFEFQCQKAEAPTICAFKDLGILYLK